MALLPGLQLDDAWVAIALAARPLELYEPLVALQDEDSVLTSLGTHTTWDQVVTLLRMELFSEKAAVMLQGRWQCVMP